MLTKKALQIISQFKNKKASSFGMFSSNGKELRYYNYRIARHHPTDNSIIWDERNYNSEDALVVNQVKKILNGK